MLGQALNFLATPVFSINAADFIRQVTALRLPSIYQWPENAEEGALMAYERIQLPYPELGGRI